MNLETITTGFVNHCQGKGLSEHTLRAYKQDLADYQKWIIINKPEDPYSKDSISGWMLFLQTKGMAPSSIRRRIACLKVLFRWLDEDGKINNNPFYRFRATVTIPRRLPRNLKAEELKKLLRSPVENQTENFSRSDLPKHTLKLAIELLFVTGIRVGELCSIDVTDIDFGEERITIKGKGNRERIVFIVDLEVKKLLKNYLKLRQKAKPNTEKLLITTKGNQAHPDYIRRYLHKASKKAGLKRTITPHMLRHSAATQLLENGVDIRFVQKLLGHSSISTTEMYTHVSNSSLQKTIKRANTRGRLGG
ncbi:MAG: tyrosine-type recombinase/integrase [Magnetococcales bacterium]|nr:tyrosine-type recombinase/integrase [Magnetococcales bacterium]